MILQCKQCKNLAIIKVSKDFYLCAQCELKRIGYGSDTIKRWSIPSSGSDKRNDKEYKITK